MFCRIPIYPLTCGKFAMVDKEDYEKVSAYKWWARKSKRVTYAAADTPDGKISMHRLVMDAKEGEVIDHISFNGLNNCKSNLRICTNQENSRHARKQLRPTASVYKGVKKALAAQKWEAQIRLGKKRLHLGTFNLEKEAAKAYNKAAIKYYGEFAELNPL